MLLFTYLTGWKEEAMKKVLELSDAQYAVLRQAVESHLLYTRRELAQCKPDYKNDEDCPDTWLFEWLLDKEYELTVLHDQLCTRIP
jgi:hypothetical protein